MAGTVVAVFPNKREAEKAAQALLDDGVPLEDITIVAKDAGGEVGKVDAEATPTATGEEFLTEGVREVATHDVEQPVNLADEAVARGIVGAVIGAPSASLLVSPLVYFHSIYVLTYNHPLAVPLVSALVGGIIGAWFCAATAGQIPAEVARGYHDQVQSGRALVTTLSSSSLAPHLQALLRDNGGRRLGFFPRFLDSLQSVESQSYSHGQMPPG